MGLNDILWVIVDSNYIPWIIMGLNNVLWVIVG